jgi:hypothetical protein
MIGSQAIEVATPYGHYTEQRGAPGGGGGWPGQPAYANGVGKKSKPQMNTDKHR